MIGRPSFRVPEASSTTRNWPKTVLLHNCPPLARNSEARLRVARRAHPVLHLGLLFVSQGNHRIDPRSRSRGNERGQHRNQKKSRDTPKNDTASTVLTPNRIARIKCAAPAALMMPIAKPARTGRVVSRRINSTTSRLLAPRAMRIPTSRVRRTTA